MLSSRNLPRSDAFHPHDPQTQIRRIPPLHAQDRAQDRPIFQVEQDKRRNLGTFDSRAAAEKHEREVQYFKRH